MVLPMHAPPRMCAVLGVPARVSVASVMATPPTLLAKRLAMSVASAMKAEGAGEPGSSLVTSARVPAV